MRQLERRIEQRGIFRAVVATQRTEILELGVRGGRRIGQRLTTLDRRQQRPGISLHLELGLFNLQRLADLRSEEHTSELQSLLRTSYAVFCLKTKTRLY